MPLYFFSSCNKKADVVSPRVSVSSFEGLFTSDGGTSNESNGYRMDISSKAKEVVYTKEKVSAVKK